MNEHDLPDAAVVAAGGVAGAVVTETEKMSSNDRQQHANKIHVK